MGKISCSICYSATVGVRKTRRKHLSGCNSSNRTKRTEKRSEISSSNNNCVQTGRIADCQQGVPSANYGLIFLN